MLAGSLFAVTQDARIPLYAFGAALIAWLGLMAVIAVARPDWPSGPIEIGILVGVSLGLLGGVVITASH